MCFCVFCLFFWMSCLEGFPNHFPIAMMFNCIFQCVQFVFFFFKSSANFCTGVFSKTDCPFLKFYSLRFKSSSLSKNTFRSSKLYYCSFTRWSLLLKKPWYRKKPTARKKIIQWNTNTQSRTTNIFGDNASLGSIIEKNTIFYFLSLFSVSK